MKSHLCDIGFRCNEVTEASHGSGSVQHPLVHVDVQNLSAHLHLSFSDAQRLLHTHTHTQMMIWECYMDIKDLDLSDLADLMCSRCSLAVCHRALPACYDFQASYHLKIPHNFQPWWVWQTCVIQRRYSARRCSRSLCTDRSWTAPDLTKTTA